MPPELTASLCDGILMGCVYGVAAMGLTLIWGVMRVVNLGHGAIMALGMFALSILVAHLGLNHYLALAGVALLGFVCGVGMYWTAVHRLIDAPYLSTLLSTFAVNMVLIGLGTAIFTTTPRNIDFAMPTVRIGPLAFPGTRLAAAAIAVLVTAGLHLFLHRSRTGAAIRAVASNRAAAELMGIPSSRMLALSFGIGAMLAAVAGGLIATIFPFTILSGEAYQMRSFVVCVLGGMGNPLGALAGGIVLGLLEGGIPFFTPVSWVPVIEFAIFVLVLMVRPTGLFGGER